MAPARQRREHKRSGEVVGNGALNEPENENGVEKRVKGVVRGRACRNRNEESVSVLI